MNCRYFLRSGPALSKLPLMLLSFAALPALAASSNWPGWRGGPDGSGRVTGQTLPLKWNATDNVLWKTPLPERGNSTPAVWGNRVFVTQALEEQKQRTLICLDASTGKKLWQKGVAWPHDEPSHRTNPYCSASPVTDGERVIAWFGSAGLVAYDFEGNELWRRDLGIQEHMWGYGGSPLLHGNHCILFFGPGKRQFLIAVDKKTGRTTWQTEPPPIQKRPRTDGFSGREDRGVVGSFASPILVNTDDRTDLVMSFPQWLAGYDPATGQERWRCDGLNELIYASPIAGEGVIVAVGGYRGTSIAVKTGGSGDVTKTHRLWRKERTKNRLGSGVVHDGHIYILNSDGIAECIRLESGEQVWSERLPKRGPDGGSWSSMVLSGERIYILNQSGDTVILEASPTFRVIGTNPLDKSLTNASIAVSNGRLYIRTHNHLWCIADPIRLAP